MDDLASTVIDMRPFVPAKDFAQSVQFYESLGFKAYPLGDQLAHLKLGAEPGRFGFLLQDFYVKEFADNLMMHLMVRDVDRWWAHIASLSLETRFGVRAPRPPKLEPWGLRVAYVFDPSGVLWHIAQEAETP